MVIVGLIGDGPRASVHRDRYAKLDSVESVETATVGERESVDDLVESVDTVDVCSPPDTRRDIAEVALARDTDVLCSPPIGDGTSDAAAVERAAAESEGTVLAGLPSRFAPGHANVADSVGDNSVGEPGVVRITRAVPTGRSDEWHDWYADDGGTGDLLFDFALLDFDFLRWTVGDVERVFTRCRSAGAIEHAVTLLAFSSGARAHVETVRGSLPDLSYRVEMDVAGDAGLVQYDTADAAAFAVETAGGDTEVPYAEPPLTDGDGRDAYDHMLAHFLACVEGNEEPRATADDGTRAQRLAAAARQSVETGRPVAVEEGKP